MSEQSIITVLVEDVVAQAFYDYQPWEPTTHEDPGCASEVTLNAICVDGVNLMDVLKDSVLADIKVECFDAEENSDDETI